MFNANNDTTILQHVYTLDIKMVIHTLFSVYFYMSAPVEGICRGQVQSLFYP